VASALAIQFDNKPVAAPDMDITRLYKTPSVEHGVTVVTTGKSILLAGIPAIFLNMTCDKFHQVTTLASCQGCGQPHNL
jgi:hypothetical protein